jgi:hypothetical protein
MPQNILCLFPQIMFSPLVKYLDSAISINVPFGTISHSIFPAAKMALAFSLKEILLLHRLFSSSLQRVDCFVKNARGSTKSTSSPSCRYTREYGVCRLRLILPF